MKKFIATLMAVVMMLSLCTFQAAAAEEDLTLTITPSITKADVGTETIKVIYTIKVTPKADTKVGAFAFTLDAPAGMTLSETKLKTATSNQGGEGYWVASKTLKWDDDEETGIFTTFEYTPGTKYFAAAGGTQSLNLTSEAVVMTIMATIEAGKSGDFTLNAKDFKVADPLGKEISGRVNTTTVTIANPTVAVTKIELNKTATTLEVGQNETLTVTKVEPSNATNKNVTWASSDSSVATVDQKGVVIAKKVGTTTITATAKDGSGVSGQCTVTVVPATCKHTNKTDVSAKVSTCTAKGWDAYKKCSDCGQLFDMSGNPISAIPYHALANHTGGTATCTAKAVCDVCGNEYGEKDSTNHASTDIDYVTTSTTHQKMHKCCETPAEATPVNHTWSNGVCSVCKYECKHDYSYTKIAGQDEHTKACKLCDVSEAVPCSGGTATCTKQPICKDCNTAYGNTVPHNTGKIEAKAATCLVAGNEEYWVCSTCLGYFKDKAATQPIANKNDVIIAAKGHHYGTGYVSDATGHWHICEDCGAKDTVAQHTFKDGTPTETEAKKCLTCGYVAANPTGEHKTHNPSRNWNGVDDNYHWHTCDNCNEKIDKTAHDFDTAVIDKPATKTEAGQQHKVCKTCGYIKCEVIPATGTTGGTTGGNGNNANAKNPYEKNDTTKKDDGKKVESGRTFDAGIALYVGLSLLSVTGGALVIGKKKEF